jgi:hypothetical protein
MPAEMKQEKAETQPEAALAEEPGPAADDTAPVQIVTEPAADEAASPEPVPGEPDTAERPSPSDENSSQETASIVQEPPSETSEEDKE